MESTAITTRELKAGGRLLPGFPFCSPLSRKGGIRLCHHSLSAAARGGEAQMTPNVDWTGFFGVWLKWLVSVAQWSASGPVDESSDGSSHKGASAAPVSAWNHLINAPEVPRGAFR